MILTLWFDQIHCFGISTSANKGKTFPDTMPPQYFLADCFAVLDEILHYKRLLPQALEGDAAKGSVEVTSTLQEFKQSRCQTEAYTWFLRCSGIIRNSHFFNACCGGVFSLTLERPSKDISGVEKTLKAPQHPAADGPSYQPLYS